MFDSLSSQSAMCAPALFTCASKQALTRSWQSTPQVFVFSSSGATPSEPW